MLAVLGWWLRSEMTANFSLQFELKVYAAYLACLWRVI